MRNCGPVGMTGHFASLYASPISYEYSNCQNPAKVGGNSVISSRHRREAQLACHGPTEKTSRSSCKTWRKRMARARLCKNYMLLLPKTQIFLTRYSKRFLLS